MEEASAKPQRTQLCRSQLLARVVAYYALGVLFGFAYFQNIFYYCVSSRGPFSGEHWLLWRRPVADYMRHATVPSWAIAIISAFLFAALARWTLRTLIPRGWHYETLAVCFLPAGYAVFLATSFLIRPTLESLAY